MLARNGEHFIHVATQTKKMDRNERDNGLMVFIDQSSFDAVTIFVDVAPQSWARNVVGLGIDVDEDGRRPDARNAAACCEK